MEGQSDDVKYPEKKLQSPPFASSHEILEKVKWTYERFWKSRLYDSQKKTERNLPIW